MFAILGLTDKIRAVTMDFNGLVVSSWPNGVHETYCSGSTVLSQITRECFHFQLNQGIQIGQGNCIPQPAMEIKHESLLFQYVSEYYHLTSGLEIMDALKIQA